MTDNTTSEENKTIVRRVWEEFFIQGNLDKADEFFAPDYVNHDPAAPEDRHGPEELSQFLSMYHTAFPDMQFTIEDMIAEGDEIVVRWTVCGTHQGELMGIPPTNNRVTVTGMSIERVFGDKIVETWDNYDALGLMQQVGVIPESEQAQGA
jgi:steroid delta-isomerase-like uncharacterized protein